MRFSKYFDHTDLRPDARLEDITRLCLEAMRYRFMSVCVNPFYVPVAARLLKGSDVKVCTVVGFPLGQQSVATKEFETRDALANGADEIDYVVNLTEVKALKVILETCLLDRKEIIQASLAAKRGGADYVKTSTGFGKWGAKAKDVALMRNAVGESMGVKASGGIRTLDDCYRMIDAGASRIGSSRSVEIMEELLASRR